MIPFGLCLQCTVTSHVSGHGQTDTPFMESCTEADHIAFSRKALEAQIQSWGGCYRCISKAVYLCVSILTIKPYLFEGFLNSCPEDALLPSHMGFFCKLTCKTPGCGKGLKEAINTLGISSALITEGVL